MCRMFASVSISDISLGEGECLCVPLLPGFVTEFGESCRMNEKVLGGLKKNHFVSSDLLVS